MVARGERSGRERSWPARCGRVRVAAGSYGDGMGERESERRRDERVQDEALGALQRILDVLHDVSDGIQELQRLQMEASSRADPSPIEAPGPLLLSIDGAAELIGISSSSMRRMCDASYGPTTVRIGSRIFLHRTDLDQWLEEARHRPGGETVRWRDAPSLGRVGSTVPKVKRAGDEAWCSGSHSEPRSASAYSGRGVCRACGDDVLINRSGLLRKHRRWRW